MTTQSRIEWTERTWNPVVGCTKISPGCKNCYAETMARRLKAIGAPGYENGFRLTQLPSRLGDPLRRGKPTTYFVNSMSDLFHEKVSDSYIAQVLGVVESTPQHTYQVLTKRAERMATYFAAGCPIPSNAWMGVSVENRRHDLPRIDHLRRVPARVRFLSVEPLLEQLGLVDLSGIHWVIVGGESGPRARRMLLEWVEGIRRQCEEQGVAFFFKQWGMWGPDGVRRSKKVNGRELQGRTWDDVPAI
ncbi:MAG: phage Gp37/Gp68 family protein [Rubrivivax sp.]